MSGRPRIALIGLGLIGSSLAWALRGANVACEANIACEANVAREANIACEADAACETGLVPEILGYDVSDDVRARARAVGFADAVTDSVEEAVRDADLIAVCVPVLASGAVAAAIGPHLKPGAIVFDVGSVKQAVIEAVAPHLPAHAHFVPAHPIAGTEHSGPESGFSTLFRNRWCVLTPPEGTDPAAVERVAALWRACGSQVELMSAEHHDRVLAITSHLPHLIAYTIVGTVTDLETHTQSEVIKFSASGFRDFTRIAASDPTMWRDVFLTNREAVLEMLGRFTEDLAALQRAIRWGDGDTLFALFTRTRAIRRGIIEAGQETPEPDFGRRHGELPLQEPEKSAAR